MSVHIWAIFAYLNSLVEWRRALLPIAVFYAQSVAYALQLHFGNHCLLQLHEHTEYSLFTPSGQFFFPSARRKRGTISVHRFVCSGKKSTERTERNGTGNLLINK